MKKTCFLILLCLTTGLALAQNATVITDILKLKPGTEAKLILKKFGKPKWWGNINRKLESRDYILNDSIRDGNAGPLGYYVINTGKMSWVYLKPGKDFSETNSCIIVMFTSNKLDWMVQGSINGFDNS